MTFALLLLAVLALVATVGAAHASSARAMAAALAVLVFALVAFLGTWVKAQEPVRIDLNGDWIELRRSAEGHLAELEYSNSASRVSRNGSHELEYDGVRVRVIIRVGGVDAEDMRVEVLTPGLVAYPPEAQARDGFTAVVQIMRPMF